MKALIALLAVIGLLAVYGLVDAIDRGTEDRIAYRRWVADACTPKVGETVVASHDGRRLHCTIYSRAGYGRAPVVVSAAVMESPL